MDLGDASSISAEASATFIFFANVFASFVLLNTLTTEWEQGLRGLLVVGGMLDSAYWLSYWLVEMVLAAVASLTICGAGKVATILIVQL